MADSKKYDGSQWEHSLRKLTTATEAVENPLYSDGTPITAYTLKGNEKHTGTPSPQNPVMPNGAGVRTENLFYGFDYFGTVPSISTGQNVSYANGASTDYIPIESPIVTLSKNQTYTATSIFIFLYDANKQFIGVTASTNIAEYSTNISGYADAKFCRVRCDKYEQYGTEYMLNTGSTAKPFEPYGYKIPISSGGVTTNIYLGSTQTVRQIKKLELTGNEIWETQRDQYRNNTALFTLWQKTIGKMQNRPSVNTHFISVASGVNPQRQNYVCSGYHPLKDYSTYYYIRPSFSAIGITSETTAANAIAAFKAWLADQYSNGTPVTVWYVLATAETATVNEPLMKIGTYSDTLSNATAIPTTEGANSITVDTTVQPSEFTATWTGWHDANVKEWDGSDWQ